MKMNDMYDGDKVLVAWIVKNGTKHYMHNQGKVVYGTFNEDSKSIEFGSHGVDGWWPIKDYTYIQPEHVGELEEYMTDAQTRFADKHGVYVMFVQPIKAESKNIRFCMEC